LDHFGGRRSITLGNRQIPCETCITLATCIGHETYHDLFINLKCPILEEYIDEEEVLHSCMDALDCVKDWYREKTGRRLC
jgi:hypothetical protein